MNRKDTLNLPLKNMRYFFISVLLALTASCLHAQESGLLTLRIEARLDYMQEYLSADKNDGNSGFKGRYLNIRMDGNLAEGFSYSYRQRLNKPNANASFFDATDWLTISYNYRNWGLSAGKQVVAIGGYEYDRAPIDLYFCSEYWNNIACYQLGVSGTYTTDEGKDKFLLQFCQSPFRTNALNADNKEMFSYNLMWYGSHGIFSSMYSVNMIEWLPGRFINYVVLGNRFDFGRFALELDYMNRAVSARDFFGRDFSVMSELSWRPIDRLNVFVRATYDLNNTGETGDLCVTSGTDIFRVGGGIEFYPLKESRNLRLHLNCCYTDGMSPASAVLKPRQTIADAGITWHMNMLNIKRRR